jgi:hypothetical protein
VNEPFTFAGMSTRGTPWVATILYEPIAFVPGAPAARLGAADMVTLNSLLPSSAP